MSKKGSGTVTDSDQAVWNAHVEEALKMAAKCEQIWREKMEREKTERKKMEEKEDRQEQLSTDPTPVSSRFWSWRCTGHMPAQRWRIRPRTRLNGGIFHRLITS